MIFVTAGFKHLDIDAYGGCVAYAELLRLQGYDAVAYSSAPWNESISRSIRDLKISVQTNAVPKSDDQFVLIDISEPEYFDHIVNLDNVLEVVDHHLGFEKLWQERIGDKAHIEFIGAACTLVYERWRDAGLLAKMSQGSARLLVAGILDNTLNLHAEVTTNRDRDAYADLMAIAKLNAYWPKIYFAECTASILADVDNALDNDSKTVDYKSYPETIVVGQMAVWDAQEALDKYNDRLVEWFKRRGNEHWLMSVISVGEGRSYFMTNNEQVKTWLSTLLDVEFKGDVAVASRMWLRKEIFKQDLEQS